MTRSDAVSVEWPALTRAVEALARESPSAAVLEKVDAIERQALRAAADERPADRSDLLCAVSLFHFYSTPEPRNALAPARAALQLAEKADDPVRLRKALTIYGIAAADTNDVGMAIHCYEQALRIVVQLGDARAHCAVLNNLGTALTASAAYTDAVACYRRVVILGERSDDAVIAQIVASARANMALCHFHLEEPGKGMVAMDRALANIGEPIEGYGIVARVLMEYTYTRLLLGAGKLESAKERSAIAMHYASLWQAPRAIVAAQNAQALVAVFEGQFESGIRRLVESLAMTVSLKAAYRDTLAALVMACERANRIDLALSYQKELLAVTSRVAVLNVQFHHELHAQKIISGEAERNGGVSALARDHLERLTEKKDEYDEGLQQLETLERIAVTTASREDPSGGHPYRVARLVSLLAARRGLDPTACRSLDLAVRLHDIGNVGVADRIMLSSRQITERERHDVEAHVLVGFDLLNKYDGPELQLAAAVARDHHERWDGAGYPGRLAGSQIPLAARMTSIAESYDALTHRRSHRAAFDPDAALEIIRTEAGASFDPDLTDAFADLVTDLRASHADVDDFLESGARASRFIRSRRQIGDLLADRAAVPPQ